MNRVIIMYAHHRQADRRTNIMAVARRFVLTYVSRAKNVVLDIECCL